MKETAKNETDVSHSGTEKREGYPPAKAEYRSAVKTKEQPIIKTPLFGATKNQSSAVTSINTPVVATPIHTPKTLDVVKVDQSKFNWVVIKLRSKPIYPLQREVLVCHPPQVVATRICDSLRLRSISASYKNCEAYCKTAGYLKYVIHLYENPDGGTIVEVLRLSGCGFAFRDEREAVVNAANNGSVANVESQSPCVLKIPESLMKELQYKPPTESQQKDMLENATDRLHSARQDEQLYILQNLATITSSEKVNCVAASQMARLILQNACDVRDFLFSLVNTIKPEKDDFACAAQNACLSIFANCFSITSQEMKLQELLSDSDASEFAQSMVCTLCRLIKQCYCPHTTAIALRTLCVLLQNSPDAKSMMCEEYRSFVKNAESIGELRHRKLEQEAKSALAALQW